jgi:hypothetical protein
MPSARLPGSLSERCLLVHSTLLPTFGFDLSGDGLRLIEVLLEASEYQPDLVRLSQVR